MKIKALIILIVLTLSSITQAKLPPPGSTKGAKANILIMLDMSYSMYVEQKQVCKKIKWLLLCFPTYVRVDIDRHKKAKDTIKRILDNPELTKGANFGLMSWGTEADMLVKIGPNGADKIRDKLYKIGPAGGTELDIAMLEASKYFKNENNVKNLNLESTCQKTSMIVISDGEWTGKLAAENTARDLKSLYNIKTFVVGFQGGGSQNYIDLATAGGTFRSPKDYESPQYANNPDKLTKVLTDYIRQEIASDANQTFTAPVVMPSVSKLGHVYQSTFKYKNFNDSLGACSANGKDRSSCQWEGELAKYKLNSNGTVSTKSIWKAGKKLDATSEHKRKIWTIANDAGISTSLNNFTTNNSSGLKNLIWENTTKPEDKRVKNLIKFVRGVDAYDEDKDNNSTEKRWKLGDIYHSQLAVVGKPDAPIASQKHYENTEAFYRHNNKYLGFKARNSKRKEMVYVGANDGMLHAFNSSNGTEGWAFIPPTMLQNLSKLESSFNNRSNSIYGVDGSVVVKDIFYGGKWRTVLIAGMGRGGYGYFSLDVTNPNKPIFLFAFQNNIEAKSIYYWDNKGKRIEKPYSGITPEYNYSKLGQTWSSPIIMAIPYDESKTHNKNQTDKRKWVAVFGAGYSENNTYGSAVYVIDLENGGKVLNAVDLTDKSNNGIANSVPATLTAITPDTTTKAKYRGAMLYVADLESKLWKINLTDQGKLLDKYQLFDAGATRNNDRLSFFSVTPSIDEKDTLWLYYATGNQQDTERKSDQIKNMIFGIKDKHFQKINGSTSNNTNLVDATGKTPRCQDITRKNGWLIRMDRNNERSTGKLALSNNTVFVSKYQPNEKSICGVGTSILSEYDFTCGNILRSTELGGGIATGSNIYNNKAYIGISGGDGETSKDKENNKVFKRDGNLIILNPLRASDQNKTINPESWREIF